MSRFPAIRRRYKTETRDLTPAQAPETRDPVAGATTKIRPRSRGRIAWHGKISLEKGVHSMTKRVTLRRRSLDFEERVDEVRTKCRLSREKKRPDFVEEVGLRRKVRRSVAKVHTSKLGKNPALCPKFDEV